MGGQGLAASESLSTKFAGQCDREVAPFNVPVQMRCFLVRVIAIGTFPQFPAVCVLRLQHLALNALIIARWFTLYNALIEVG